MNHRQSAEMKAKHELHEFLLIFRLKKNKEIAINATDISNKKKCAKKLEPETSGAMTNRTDHPAALLMSGGGLFSVIFPRIKIGPNFKPL